MLPLVMAALALSGCAPEAKELPPPLNPASAEAGASSMDTPRSLAGPLPREAAPLESAPGGTDMSGHDMDEHMKGHAAGGEMNGHEMAGAAAGNGPKDAPKPMYACPMHPEVRQDRPGTCPKCGMKLVPEKTGAGGDHP